MLGRRLVLCAVAGAATLGFTLVNAAADTAAPAAPQDITVKDPLGVACIDVGAAGCTASNVAVSTGGPATACGTPEIALSPFTGEASVC